MDDNHNGCFESARLNWNPDVIGGSGPLTLIEKVYFSTNNGSSWTLIYTTPPHDRTSGTSDPQHLDRSEDPSKGNCTAYDYKIEVYRSGASIPDDTRDRTNDPNLQGHQEEGIPDLIVWGPSIAPYITTTNFTSDACAIGHGCAQSGIRQLLRFGNEVRNIGMTDLFFGDPATNPLFVYDTCHGHYHFAGFANYHLLDSNGQVAAGNKLGFCLEDWSRWDPSSNPNAKYTCTNQGIQSGWADYYWGTLTCQWIDITGVPPGTYTLRITVNETREVKESNYTNNSADVEVIIPDTDGDGLPDQWELGYGLDPNDPTDAPKDTDGDGFTNLEEFYAGTNPQDPASSSAITATEPVGSDVRVTFQTVLERHYRLRKTDMYPSGPWTDVQTVSGTGGLMQVIDLNAASLPKCFYQVQVLP